MTAEPVVPAWLDGLGATVVVRIVGTVELERALREHGGAVDLVATARADDLLGARVVLLPAGSNTTVAAPPVALAEPSTEGRLAATLARHDEGPAGAYLGVGGGLAAIRAAAGMAGAGLSRPAVTPFGLGLLVLGGPLGGPSLILVDAAAVPSRP